MTYKKSLAIVLSIILVLIMGTMYQSYASHTTDHTHHHTPATHSAGICSWMCAAAQIVSGDVPIISHTFRLIALIEPASPAFPTLISSVFRSTRGPPH